MPFHTVSSTDTDSRCHLYGNTESNSSFSETSAANLTKTSECQDRSFPGRISHTCQPQGEKPDHDDRGQDLAGVRLTA